MTNHTINGYVELASPQLIDNQWRELNFDLAFSHNILQDLVVPESGGGYVYRDAKSTGSAVQNRFIYWRTVNDILELIEVSTEVLLDENQIRIKFANSPIIANINVIELSDSIIIVVPTLTSVHKIHLPHPKTTDKSIFADLNRDVLFNPSNYYILSNQNNSINNSQQPICSTSWFDKNFIKCALSFPDSSISIVQFGLNHHHISVSVIKQVGIIGRLWSKMPSLLNKTVNDCDNAIYVCLSHYEPVTQDVILFTLCRDWKIRLFSTNTKECLCTHSMIPQSSFSQSIISHTNSTTEQPIMKMIDSQVIIYQTENRPEFVFLDYEYSNGTHALIERSTCQAPIWEKLIDFHVTDHKIWALANVQNNESALCYLERSIVDCDEDGEIEAIWDFVSLVDDLEVPNVKNFVAEIFWRNHFSINTIQKALIGVAGSSLPKKNNLEALEELAFTNIVDENQEEAWTRFYNYCLQNHLTANKNIGLFLAIDESVIGLVKRSNPSLICPWLTSVDMLLQGGPYRAIEFSNNYRAIVESLNYICRDLIDDDHSYRLEQRTFENPSNVMDSIRDVMKSQLRLKKVDMTKLNTQRNLAATISAGIDGLCEQLDMTSQAAEYCLFITQDVSTKFKIGQSPLSSNSGITITFELFKRLVRARMTLCRDLLIYLYLREQHCDSDRSSDKFCVDIYTSGKFASILDSFRSYSILVWMCETPIKSFTDSAKEEVINFISKHFSFFKKANNNSERNNESILEQVIRQNLFMSFLVNGGTSFSNLQRNNNRTLSNTYYVTDIVINLCKLLWPKSNHQCFAEYLFTHQLDEHLSKYLDLTENWLQIGEFDRHFIRAANCLIQNRASQSVDTFNKLWSHIKPDNLLGRFTDLGNFKAEAPIQDEYPINPSLINRYYDNLLQLFQIYEDHQSLVTLINECMSLLDEHADNEQQHWVNCLRAKLFQYYLELDDPSEAYHTMVLTSDPSLRTNCLRKFIVHHCEKQQWMNLLAYPYIDIMFDFIDILIQKAENSDLSTLNENSFYQTSFYDLLYASYVSEDEFKRAAEVMYNYAQRLAYEVPGMVSIRKQSDCLLIALNTLRCVEPDEAFIRVGPMSGREDCRGGVFKRSYDGETETPTSNSLVDYVCGSTQNATKIYLSDIEMKYELTKARLKLLEKNPTGNAIALSPLKAEEIIFQLVNSNMFSAAMDLAVLMKAPMEPILEGLTDKYIFLMGTTINVDINPDLESGLSDIFTHSYTNIDTYNYIANSTCNMVDKIWCLIDYYLNSYDGIIHRYSTNTFKDTFSGTTVLMKVVATRILAAGYDVPASLRRMYISRNVSELLRLLMKYDKLVEAAELAVEMVDRVLEPANTFTIASQFSTSEPPPIFLPTHLILLLVSFLNEDATNTHFIKISNEVMGRLSRFQAFLKSN